MHHQPRRVIFMLLCGFTLLTACGSAPAPVSQVDLQATIDAGVRATLATQPTQTPLPDLPPSPTAVPPAATTAPTSPPVAPTVAPFTPSTPVTTPTGATENTPTVAPDDNPASDDTNIFRPAEGEASRIVTNIQLVFDASGSMVQKIGNETKIQAARRAMERVIDALPDNPDLNVGFRVFGHEGDSSEAQKARSCQSTALLVPMQGVNKELLRQQTQAWQPTGWTPISLALQKAGEDFQSGERVRNVIIMVTDGEETCGGDPCAVAKALAESQATVRIDVVGFGLTPDVAKTLRCITENSGGVYTDAQNGDALVQTLEELITATLQRSTLRLIPVGIDGAPEEVSLSRLINEQGEDVLKTVQLPWMARFAREQVVELPPGQYRFTISYIEIGGDQTPKHIETTYTAIIEEARETVAVIGRGQVTFINDSPQSLRAGDVRVEKAVDGQWEESISPGQLVSFGAYFAFERPFRLTPGRYRVYDRKQGKVLIDNLIIVPGKEITVRLSSG